MRAEYTIPPKQGDPVYVMLVATYSVETGLYTFQLGTPGVSGTFNYQLGRIIDGKIVQDHVIGRINFGWGWFV